MAAVAGNNMVALRGTRDLFDSWKKCRANIASEAQLKKLTKRQRCASRLTALAASPALLAPATLPARATLPAPRAACCPARLGRTAQGPGCSAPPGGAATAPTTGAALRPSARAKVAEVAPCVF